MKCIACTRIDVNEIWTTSVAVIQNTQETATGAAVQQAFLCLECAIDKLALFTRKRMQNANNETTRQE